MTTMKIKIETLLVMLTYEHEDCIEISINSIKKQTHKNFKALVIDVFKPVDDLLYILSVIRVGDQKRIWGVDDEDVLNSNGRDQSVFALDEGVLALHKDRITR